MRVRIPNSKFLILNSLAATLLVSGCGRKGPPLPPFVRTPIAPGELTATRRGDTVDIKFVVPSSNTDQTRPANIERIDIYALTTATRVADLDIVSRGERIASVEVKTPRDPNKTIDPDEPASDLEPLEGPGLDQGATTEVFETLAATAAPGDARGSRQVAPGTPLVGPSCQLPTRVYVGLGISVQGRRGLLSAQAGVPLVPAPAPLPRPAVKYNESGVTIAWQTAASGPPAVEAPAGERLESRPIGCNAPTVGYYVYEVAAEQSETRLTDKPLAGSPFVDPRIAWDTERCYTVRAVHSIGALSVESEPAPPVCEKLTDTFPPAAPKGLVAVASEGAINLIWDANTDKDLAGYIVLRAPASTKEFTTVTDEPLRDTTFTDKVPVGTPFVYAIRAVDSNGNRSAPSAESPAESAR
jgi:Prokaryotic lipoprotein-attachment site